MTDENENKGLEEPMICGIILASGHEVICVMQHEKEKNRYFLNNPAIVGLKPDAEDPTKMNVFFSPFCPSAALGQVSVVPQQLVALYAPSEQLISEWKTKFKHPGLPKGEKRPKFEG